MACVGRRTAGSASVNVQVAVPSCATRYAQPPPLPLPLVSPPLMTASGVHRGSDLAPVPSGDERT